MLCLFTFWEYLILRNQVGYQCTQITLPFYCKLSNLSFWACPCCIESVSSLEQRCYFNCKCKFYQCINCFDVLFMQLQVFILIYPLHTLTLITLSIWLKLDVSICLTWAFYDLTGHVMAPKKEAGSNLGCQIGFTNSARSWELQRMDPFWNDVLTIIEYLYVQVIIRS